MNFRWGLKGLKRLGFNEVELRAVSDQLLAASPQLKAQFRLARRLGNGFGPLEGRLDR